MVLGVAAASLPSGSSSHLCHSFSLSFPRSSLSLSFNPSFLPVRHAPKDVCQSRILVSFSSSLSIGVLCCQLGAHRSGRAPITRSFFFFFFPFPSLASLGGVLPVPRFNIEVSSTRSFSCANSFVSIHLSGFPPGCTISRRCVTQRGLEISRAWELEIARIV